MTLLSGASFVGIKARLAAVTRTAVLNLLTAIALCTYAGAAQAEESWFCGKSREDKSTPPSMTRYTIKNDLLVSGDGIDEALNGAPYKIIENNQYVLLAVASLTWEGLEKDTKQVGLSEITIDKITGAFLDLIALTGGGLKSPRIEQTSGSCIANVDPPAWRTFKPNFDSSARK